MLNKNKLIPYARLIDHKTKRTVGYHMQYLSTDFIFALSLPKLEELGHEFIPYHEVADCINYRVALWDNKYALLRNSQGLLEEEADTPFERVNTSLIRVYGHQFNLYDFVCFDDMSYINNKIKELEN